MSSPENPPRNKVPSSAEIPPAVTSSVEKQSDEPIVMLNPVLNRIAGLKEKKKPKEKPAPKRRKSISEGGVAYVPMVLERAFDEPTEAEIGKPEPIYMGSEEMEIPPVAPPSPEDAETRYGITKEFKKAVISLEIERQMLRAQETLDELTGLEAEANLDFFTPGRSVQERIVDAENRLFGFKQQKKNLESNLLSLDSISESAPHATFYGDIKPALDLQMESRISEMEPSAKDVMRRIFPAGNDNSKLEKKKKLSSLRATIAAIGLFTAGGAGVIATADFHTVHAGQPRAERVVRHEKVAKVIAVGTVKHGGGADSMFTHLITDLRSKYAHASQVPEIVKHMLMIKNVDSFSRAYGFLSSDGKSGRTMLAGDKIMINDAGQLVFEGIHGKPQVIIENLQHGKPPVIHKVHDHPLHPVHHAEHHAPAHHAEHPPVHVAAPEHAPYKVNTTFHGATYTSSPNESPVLVPNASSPAIAVPEAAPTKAAATPTAAESVPPPVHIAAPAMEVPKAQPQPVQPEAAPASKPQTINGEHYFGGTVGEATNAHSIDLNVPTLLFNEGRLFAHGISNDDSFKRASEMSAALFRKGREDTRVFFVVLMPDANGVERPVVQATYQPVVGGLPQLWEASDSNPMPELPKDENYTAVPASLLN